MREDEFALVEGSGNVFRDLGDPDADLKQAKAIVAARIIAVLDERALTVRKAEELSGFAAADFSRIRNAGLGRFTLDRLMKILAAIVPIEDLELLRRIEDMLDNEAAIEAREEPGRVPWSILKKELDL